MLKADWIKVQAFMDFREEIRLIGEDIRLRQTLGRKAKSNDVFLIGQYYETRIFPSHLK